jgi:hypothetical protein
VDEWASGKHDKSVWLISINPRIRRGLKKDEILLTDLEALRSSEPSNISLSNSYAPFQLGISMCNFTQGYPVTHDVRQFLIDALALQSNDIYDYQPLIKQPEPKPELINQ